MNQDHGRAAQFGQPANVLDDRLVVRGVLHGDEDGLVHQDIQPRNVCSSSPPSSPAMTNATSYARILTHSGFANSPIFARSDVNITSANTAKESCRLKMT